MKKGTAVVTTGLEIIRRLQANRKRLAIIAKTQKDDNKRNSMAQECLRLAIIDDEIVNFTMKQFPRYADVHTQNNKMAYPDDVVKHLIAKDFIEPHEFFEFVERVEDAVGNKKLRLTKNQGSKVRKKIKKQNHKRK